MARRKRKRELSELLPELQLDLSERSQRGITIRLKDEPPIVPPPAAEAGHAAPAMPANAPAVLSLPLAPAPDPEPVRYSGIRVVNGKVIREGRHTESQWNYIGLAGAVPRRIYDYAPDVVLERRADVDGVVRLLPVADTPGEPLEQLEYVVVDVETTGIGAGHRITEIAIVRVNGRGRVLDDWTTLVNPQRPIPAWITALTSINAPMVRDAPRFRDLANAVLDRLNGRIFVAHNAGFDWRFLSMELQLALGTPLRGRMLCTVRLARKFVPEVSRRSLDSLSWYFGVGNDSRHRAYGDARATAKVFARMLDRIGEREITGWNELQKVLYARSGPRKRRAMPQAMEPTP